eukprot:scaffold145145_cov30-Tisochrysis_lutea.AAC.2
MSTDLVVTDDSAAATSLIRSNRRNESFITPRAHNGGSGTLDGAVPRCDPAGASSVSLVPKLPPETAEPTATPSRPISQAWWSDNKSSTRADASALSVLSHSSIASAWAVKARNTEAAGERRREKRSSRSHSTASLSV